MSPIFRVLVVIACLLLPIKGGGASPGESLMELSKEFANPPYSAKPQVYWFWLGGQVTREGIIEDLDAMKRVGLGGGLIMTMGGSISGGPMRTIEPDFVDLVDFAAKEAEARGLALTLHNCPGWSGSGGPWIPASQSMQEVTYSEVQLTGGRAIREILPIPAAKHGFYKDIAVLAFPTPADEAPVVTSENPVVLTTDVTGMDVSGLVDGLPNGEFATFPWKDTGQFYIQAEFKEPTAISTIMLKSGVALGAGGNVMVSMDGVDFKPLLRFELKPVDALGYAHITFPKPVTARFFRLPLEWSFNDGDVKIGHIQFSNRKFNSDLHLKTLSDQPHHGSPDVAELMNRGARRSLPPNVAIQKTAILDLTSKMNQDGLLEWDAPEGEWTVVRFGHTSTGKTNGGYWSGLECDKLDPDGVKLAWSGMMEPIIERLGPLAGKVLLYAETDSWETGGQNWTSKTALMKEEFQKRRGYDLTPFLPTFTGRYVGSPEITERFLWDLRRTISELIRDNYYRPFTQLCNEAGLQSMAEPYVGPYESMENGGAVDIPMGEFWEGRWHITKIASSIANGYGKKITAAESFTGWPVIHGAWKDDPYSLKALGDKMTCWGINRFIIHRMVHQPWLNRTPGLTLSAYGLNFDRTNTWFDLAGPWLKYIARSHYMLKQGITRADIAFFCGMNSPVVDRYGVTDTTRPHDLEKEPKVPQGYYWDSINTELLMKHAKMENGRLKLESGATYSVLVLPEADPNMTPELLSRIAEFVKQGLTVVGKKPARSPSLHQYPASDEQVKKIASELWGPVNGINVTPRAVGKGRIVQGEPLEKVLRDLGLHPDVEAPPDTEFIHRTLKDGIEIYFVSNQKDDAVSGDYIFRVSGKIPELWHPETGLIERVVAFEEEGGRTRIPLKLEARGSRFVVFRDASMKSPALSPKTTKPAGEPIRIEGEWKLRFPADLGAPDEVKLDHLISWSEHEDDGVKYFSGTGTYLKEIELPKEFLEAGISVRLDLGDVKNLARVSVNGVDLGILWKPPFEVDVTSAIKPGKNQIEIQVTNLWVNRLVGDEQLPYHEGFERTEWTPDYGSVMKFIPEPPQWFKDGKPCPSGRIAFTTNSPFKKDSELFPSGLLGPVRLIPVREVDLTNDVR